MSFCWKCFSNLHGITRWVGKQSWYRKYENCTYTYKLKCNTFKQHCLARIAPYDRNCKHVTQLQVKWIRKGSIRKCQHLQYQLCKEVHHSKETYVKYYYRKLIHCVFL